MARPGPTVVKLNSGLSDTELLNVLQSVRKTAILIIQLALDREEREGQWQLRQQKNIVSR